jgi:hypothetical protein
MARLASNSVGVLIARYPPFVALFGAALGGWRLAKISDMRCQ